MDEETKVLIDGLDRRLQEVERKLTGKATRLVVEPEGEKSYSGLKGGITLLMEEHFFDVPKSLDETIKQLAVKGYHHQSGAVQAALARDFMKKRRLLTRIREENKYKYVVRK